jgi:3-isopropylmalate dehydrogenase
MDLVLVRENSEGMYAVRAMHAGAGEFMPSPDIALAVRKVSRPASRAIARAAFALARRRRRHLTIVHKANVLRLSDGLFLESVREIGRDFPDVEAEELLVDAAAAMLVRAPASFDVLVTTNMFGDILSNEAAELSGSLGLSGSLNRGERQCVAQAAHGSAPTIAGQNIANPIGLISSVAMLLQHLGIVHDDSRFLAAHDSIESAIDDLLLDPAARTRDLGGECPTDAFAARLARRLSHPGRAQIADAC